MGTKKGQRRKTARRAYVGGARRGGPFYNPEEAFGAGRYQRGKQNKVKSAIEDLTYVAGAGGKVGLSATRSIRKLLWRLR